jgi:hypothetical protein
MQRKSINKLCMFIVLAATLSLTLVGCTEDKIVFDGNNATALSRVVANANNFTLDNKEPSRLQGLQDRVSVQHR